ncbi:MAG: ATPase [Synergistaceae bacterium]|nr:ATPase [Synergistaceae bacterium]
MAVMKMVALTMIGPDSEMGFVAREMVLTGEFQPLPLDVLVNDRELRSKITTSTENPYDELLSKVTSIWKVAGGTIPESSPVNIGKEFTLSNARYKVDQISKRLEVWDERRRNLQEEEEVFSAAKILLETLKDTEFTPADLIDSDFVVAFFGRIINENYQRLADSSNGSLIAINELATMKGNKWLLILTTPDYEESTKKLLNAVSFKEFSLSEISQQLEGDDPFSLLDRRLDGHKKAIKGLERVARDALHEHRDDYKLLYSQLYTMQRVYDVCKGRGEISGMFLLSGWIPADTLESVKITVEKEAPMTTIIVEETEELERSGIIVPTLLKNNFLFRSFQDIVAMYSLPAYGEIDPSPIIAISFVLFFGFMFGDVGHGLMIFLAAYFMVKNGMMTRSFGQVVKSSAVSSMIFGVLYGSVFGLEDIIKPLWLSPMRDTNLLIVIAICMGFFMISFGLILNMIKQFKNKDFGRLLFDGQGLAGLILYWSLGALAAIKITGTEISNMTANILLVGILLMIVLMIFRNLLASTLLRQKSDGESTVLNLFGIMHSLLSFLSNTASFVRLAAFALNHVGLSIAVIMLADMVHNLPGGIVMKGIILLLGNIVIVCLEGLIVFIQTLRLHYYEFFSKFYDGGGTAFKPVGWKKSDMKHFADSK